MLNGARPCRPQRGFLGVDSNFAAIVAGGALRPEWLRSNDFTIQRFNGSTAQQFNESTIGKKVKLSEMRELLARKEIQLTKSLGQNFLHDANQLHRIVAAAELSKSDKVLEIGPGLGPLTELLQREAGEVLAIEKDARLVEFLCERFGVTRFEQLPDRVDCSSLNTFSPAEPARAGRMPALLLLHDDALDFLKRNPRDWSDWKTVSNLPYSVASPILVELALTNLGPKRIVATLQLEVARRIAAKPGNKDYGVLTLLVQLNYELQTWFKIPPGSFFPEPDVDSACVVLNRRDCPLLQDAGRKLFVKIVKRAFSQRRKMMLKLLKQDWPAERLDAALEQTKISPKARAEELSLEQFVALTKELFSGG